MRSPLLLLAPAVAGCAFITADELSVRKASGFEIRSVELVPDDAFSCEGTIAVAGVARLPASFVGATVTPTLQVGDQVLARAPVALREEGGDAVYAISGDVALARCDEDDGVCDVVVEVRLQLEDQEASATSMLTVYGSPDPYVLGADVLDASGRLAEGFDPDSIDVQTYPFVRVRVDEPLWTDPAVEAGGPVFALCPIGESPGAATCVSVAGALDVDSAGLGYRLDAAPLGGHACSGDWGGSVPLFDLYVSAAGMPCGAVGEPMRVLSGVRWVDRADCDGDGETVEDGDCRPFDAGIGAPGCDGDGDGFVDASLGGVDCDDAHASVYPGAQEVCDGVDSDCDPSTSPPGAEEDVDGDGFLPCADFVALEPPVADVVGADDCGPEDPYTHPGAAKLELADCTTDVDGDGFGDASPAAGVTPGTDCADDDPSLPVLRFIDADGDGYGSTALGLACDFIGFSDRDDDCDDGDAEENPAAMWFVDGDNDGFGSDATLGLAACERPVGSYVPTAGDCDDGDATLNPLTPWYVDGDLDGFGMVPAPGSPSCAPIAGAARERGDCDDQDAAFGPGVAKVVSSGSSIQYVEDLASVVTAADDQITVCGAVPGPITIGASGVSVVGEGLAPAIEGGEARRALVVASGVVDVGVEGIRLSGAFRGPDEGTVFVGGGAFIYPDAEATFIDVTVEQNEADAGGGVVVTGQLVLVDSTIVDNTADYGAGLQVITGVSPAIVVVCNSRVEANLAQGSDLYAIDDVGHHAFIGPMGTIVSEGSTWSSIPFGISAYSDLEGLGTPDAAPAASYDVPSDLGETFVCDEFGCALGAAPVGSPACP